MPTLKKIDELLAQHHAAAKIEPAPRCDDLTFLRRVMLDLAGRIPTLEEIADFEKDPDRSGKIGNLLKDSAFARHWSELWTAMLIGYSNAFRTDREALRIWLEDNFSEGAPYDRMVKGLVAATGSATGNGAVNFVARYPNEASVKVSRLFLGVRLDCARCHDHPFDRWKEEDFTNMARFFESIERRQVGNGPVTVSNRVVTDSSNKPAFLTGAEPQTTQWRDELALLMTHTHAFAKNFANRLWYQLLGRGIVHPPDDFNAKNPPSVPALLDALADRAREFSWDFRKLVYEICDSNAYQRSSILRDQPKGALESFAVRPIKPLTPEQWYDSLATVYAGKLPVGRIQFLQRTIGPQLDEDFSETWLYRESVQQLMQQLALDLHPPGDDLDTIYLKIFGRRPTETDRETCQGHPLADVSFALINSSEFAFNH